MTLAFSLFLGLFFFGLGIFFAGCGFLWWVSLQDREMKRRAREKGSGA